MAEFKTKIVLELLEGTDTVNQIASKYDILPKLVLGWKRQFFENAALAFEPARAVKEYKNKIAAKEREIEQLQKALGKATAELDFVTKKLVSSVSLNDRRKMIKTEQEIFPYLLKKPKITQANQVWCGNITYVGLQGGFAYLAVVMDWHTKKVLSWKLDTVMDASLSTNVLKQAIQTHSKPEIFNSDQGSQYTAYEHLDLLKNNDISISMNGKGRSSDNIVVERFFRSLKYEDIYLKRYQTLKEAREGIKAYIEFYNTRRLHSSLGYDTPHNVYQN